MDPKKSVEEENRDIVYRNYYDKMQSEFLKTLVSDEVIEEYKNNVLGQHSEPLSRLLHFFNSAPQKDKYVIKRDDQANTFKIAALSGERGVPPRIIGDKEYKSLEEAYYGVFLQRLFDLLES